MTITVLNKITLEKIPSGSGITKSGDTYYIIGDDSPFLFALNKDFKTLSKKRIFDTAEFSEERIIKSKKPDFEALEMINTNEMVVFGSGSKSPERNIFMRILLKDSVVIEKYDISDLYTNLKALPIFKDSELNMEATAYSTNQIFLFNRNKNLIVKFKYTDLLSYIKGEINFPQPEVKHILLPKINGIEAGFSGATVLESEQKIIVTASVENTDNAYDDGDILGSFIGAIDISNNQISDLVSYCKIPNTDETLKVESVTIKEAISKGSTKVVLVTDDDKGNSSLIECILSW